MTISGCSGGMARNRRQHRAAQRSWGEAGRQDASAKREALGGENAVIR